MTKERFAMFLRPYIKSGTPFSAYWHPYGFGMLRTAPIQLKVYRYVLHVPGKPDKEYKDRAKCEAAVSRTRGSWMEVNQVDGKPKELSRVTRRCWQRGIEDLRRYAYGPVITVDFDGLRIDIKGGKFEL